MRYIKRPLNIRLAIPIHLFTIHPLAVGVYLTSLGVTGLVAIIGIFVSFNATVISRKSVIAACELRKYQETGNGEDSNMLLDFKMGATFGFADCDQAVQAGLIGAACSLFFGCIFMVWNGLLTNRWVLSLDSNRIGWRARNSKWNESLDDMASMYARDKRNSPTYSQEKTASTFKTTLSKLFKK
ncbi:hypothetical protein BY458DRAFT_431915 [Sporodiniella umbellata]|nr:hypothetical protein BY458DRAFT_431915 [Sporodiniella umbellata]